MNNGMNFAFLSDTPKKPKGRKVAIIGAGPSGLAAAGYLACQGYQIEVVDKLPKPGGLMVFGIPGERIPEERIMRGVRRLERDFGVRFRLRTKICCSSPLHEEAGDHFSDDMRSLAELVDDNDAVVICTGSWKSRRMGIEGQDLEGVYSGLEFLFPIRAARYAVERVNRIDVQGKNVAVVGAGFSAVDVAHAAVAAGAENVHMLYRRTREEAPCGSFEIEQLMEAGVQWRELVTPVRVLGDERATGIELLQCELGEPDESGRRCPLPGDGTSVKLDADIVVAAIGEIPTPPFPKELGLETVRRGEVHWLQMTKIDNVFVAGDALTGPSKIGKAVYSGLRAARSLTNWLDLRAMHRENEFHDELIRKEDWR